jgi:adenylylsulfate kinase-like enzyme
LRSLVDGLSCLIIIMTTAVGNISSTEVQANLSTKTRQNGDPQNPCKQDADEGEIFNVTEVQNSYKLPLDPELSVFTEKPPKSASYQCRFEDNR